MLLEAKEPVRSNTVRPKLQERGAESVGDHISAAEDGGRLLDQSPILRSNLTAFLQQQIRQRGGPRYEQADRAQRRTRKARRARDAQCESGWRFVPDGKAIGWFSASAG